MLESHKDETEPLSSPPEEATIERLMEKTINNTSLNHEEENFMDSAVAAELTPDSKGAEENDQPADGEEREGLERSEGCCPYGVKRNIVRSIEEIRRFSCEHQLATEIVKALLKILAELAVNAMKGKVSAGTLMLLLNAMNYDNAKEEAYKEGEKAGRNARIEEEYFPTVEDGIPQFNGMIKNSHQKRDDIFSIARDA